MPRVSRRYPRRKRKIRARRVLVLRARRKARRVMAQLRIRDNRGGRTPRSKPFRSFTWDGYTFIDASLLSNATLRRLKSRWAGDARAIYSAETPFKEGCICAGESRIDAVKKRMRDFDEAREVAHRFVFEHLPDAEVNPYRLRVMFAVFRGEKLVGGFVLYNGFIRSGFALTRWSTMLGATFDAGRDTRAYFERVGRFMVWLLQNPLIREDGTRSGEEVQISVIRFPKSRPDQQWEARLYAPHIPQSRAILVETEMFAGGERLILTQVRRAA